MTEIYRVVRLRAAVVREFFQRQNMTQNEFARKVGVSPSYMSLLLQEQRQPSGPTRAKLQTTMHMGFDELFVRECQRMSAAKGSRTGGR